MAALWGGALAPESNASRQCRARVEQEQSGIRSWVLGGKIQMGDVSDGHEIPAPLTLHSCP